MSSALKLGIYQRSSSRSSSLTSTRAMYVSKELSSARRGYVSLLDLSHLAAVFLLTNYPSSTIVQSVFLCTAALSPWLERLWRSV